MHRRAFLKASVALPAMAAMSTLPQLTRADTGAAGKWRVFEVTTQVDILKPAGVTRVWLPTPLRGHAISKESGQYLEGGWGCGQRCP